MAQAHKKMHNQMKISNLLLMAGLHFIAMYFLMYAMIDTAANLIPNINNFYMAGLMTTPMLVIEILLMREMYADKKAIAVLFVFSIILFSVFLLCIRSQFAVRDQEFLKSMIPHHAGAILMCEKAQLSDPELLDLCETIRTSQQSEIDFMRQKLEELENFAILQ